MDKEPQKLWITNHISKGQDLPCSANICLSFSFSAPHELWTMHPKNYGQQTQQVKEEIFLALLKFAFSAPHALWTMHPKNYGQQTQQVKEKIFLALLKFAFSAPHELYTKHSRNHTVEI